MLGDKAGGAAPPPPEPQDGAPPESKEAAMSETLTIAQKEFEKAGLEMGERLSGAHRVFLADVSFSRSAMTTIGMAIKDIADRCGVFPQDITRGMQGHMYWLEESREPDRRLPGGGDRGGHAGGDSRGALVVQGCEPPHPVAGRPRPHSAGNVRPAPREVLNAARSPRGERAVVYCGAQRCGHGRAQSPGVGQHAPGVPGIQGDAAAPWRWPWRGAPCALRTGQK